MLDSALYVWWPHLVFKIPRKALSKPTLADLLDIAE
jgi:hypothetical protein